MTTKKIKLDKEEQQVADDFLARKYNKILDDRHDYLSMAKGHKNARINLRINEDILTFFVHKAQAEGIPYQTLMNSVLYKYATGRLFERDLAKMIEHLLQSGLKKKRA